MTVPAPTDARITSERYFRLAADGLLAPHDRVELLEGVVVAMSPQDPRHAGTITSIQHHLTTLLGGRAIVRIQLPLALSGLSVPEPDVALVPRRDSFYADAHPTSALLVVEVADTSLPQDRLTKASIYAAAGVPQYLIVNLAQDVIEEHRSPDATLRRYDDTRVVPRGQRVRLVAFPDVALLVDELLPPL